DSLGACVGGALILRRTRPAAFAAPGGGSDTVQCQRLRHSWTKDRSAAGATPTPVLTGGRKIVHVWTRRGRPARSPAGATSCAPTRISSASPRGPPGAAPVLPRGRAAGS